jgi:hypothetical protein
MRPEVLISEEWTLFPSRLEILVDVRGGLLDCLGAEKEVGCK